MLVLLGFVATDFVITITLSSADAAAHLLHSTVSTWNLPVTIAMIVLLGLIFMRGFNEAIGISVILVAAYLCLNGVVIGAGLWQLIQHPDLLSGWWSNLNQTNPDHTQMVLVAALLFPKIALGLSGFETGVAVIPQIRGKNAEAKVRGARHLLLASAAIMSVLLICSSLVVTTLVPQSALEEGGPANGRALAFVAHNLLGPVFGGVYDWVTIFILWFAGASAMAGLLNLIPRYLPRFGMAPQWVARQKPLVGVVIGIALFVTVIFKANVDKQSGAYATGVLVLLFSGALATVFAVLSDGRRAKEAGVRRSARFYSALVGLTLVTLAFAYTAVVNMVERPEGLHVASFFIAGIVIASLLSRASRSYELRALTIDYDATARRLIDAATVGKLALVAHSAEAVSIQDYELKEHEIRARHNIPESQSLVFLEVGVRDASEFSSPLHVTGHRTGDASILRVHAAAVPNAIAAIAVDLNAVAPVDLYFGWSPGSPVRDMLRFLAIGKGQNAVVVHEILRRAFPNDYTRPHVHLG